MVVSRRSLKEGSHEAVPGALRWVRGRQLPLWGTAGTRRWSELSAGVLTSGGHLFN